MPRDIWATTRSSVACSASTIKLNARDIPDEFAKGRIILGRDVKGMGVIQARLLRDRDRIGTQIRREGALFRERLLTGEAREAFAERRKPDFSKVAR